VADGAGAGLRGISKESLVTGPNPHAGGNQVPVNGTADLSEAVEAEYEAIRAHLAKSETPNVLIIIAILLMVLSGVNFAIHPDSHHEFHVMDVAVGLILLIVGLLLRARTVRPSGARWAFVSCMVLMVLSLSLQVGIDPATSPGYVIVAICLVGPLALSWEPFTAGVVAMTICLSVVTTPPVSGAVSDWAFLALTAALASALLMMVRLRSLRAQAVAVVQANEMATTDPLTGVLNRRGLENVLPTFAASAKRLLLTISVYFIDVDGLKAANDAHGHAFGDEILQGVATAIRSTVRAGDLVARWGGDEFVVVGIGTESDNSEFAARLGRSIRWGGLDLSRWCGTVSVGRASGLLDAGTVEEFVTRADADMYGRRSQRRGTQTSN
jgi:diguanylate cyclase (GGDEF)-like protein